MRKRLKRQGGRFKSFFVYEHRGVRVNEMILLRLRSRNAVCQDRRNNSLKKAVGQSEQDFLN